MEKWKTEIKERHATNRNDGKGERKKQQNRKKNKGEIKFTNKYKIALKNKSILETNPQWTDTEREKNSWLEKGGKVHRKMRRCSLDEKEE